MDPRTASSAVTLLASHVELIGSSTHPTEIADDLSTLEVALLAAMDVIADQDSLDDVLSSPNSGGRILTSVSFEAAVGGVARFEADRCSDSQLRTADFDTFLSGAAPSQMTDASMADSTVADGRIDNPHLPGLEPECLSTMSAETAQAMQDQPEGSDWRDLPASARDEYLELALGCAEEAMTLDREELAGVLTVATGMSAADARCIVQALSDEQLDRLNQLDAAFTPGTPEFDDLVEAGRGCGVLLGIDPNKQFDLRSDLAEVILATSDLSAAQAQCVAAAIPQTEVERIESNPAAINDAGFREAVAVALGSC